jgi:hypothetical protein
MQKVDLYQPIVHDRKGPPPLAIRVGVNTTGDYIEGGSATGYLKPETYILLSALPVELQERVKTAVQAIISGM